jgi:hypothetical protein
VPSNTKRWPALTSATGVEEDCVDAAMSGIKGKRPLGDANEQRFNDRLQTEPQTELQTAKSGPKAAKNTTSPQDANQWNPQRTPRGRVAGGA